MKLSDFDYELPPELIATEPKEPRDSSCLLVVSKKLEDRIFSQLAEIINSDDLLVFNNAKVINAYLAGFIDNISVGVNLNRQIASDTWSVLAKPKKRFMQGKIFYIDEFFFAEIINKDDGDLHLKFNCKEEQFWQNLEKFGQIPLPPYITSKRKIADNDLKNYQTIFAEHLGAVAAPTAGLHFTEKLMDKINSAKISTAYVTLMVGAGTFLPIKTENIMDHKMHSEFILLDAKNAEIINNVRKKGKGRIIAVGTTVMRVLESIADENGCVGQFTGDTNIFITPGYNFKIVEGLITNFHVPKSSLYVLVSAFCGLNRIKEAYDYAIKNKYRFFSYGDASLLWRNN